MRLDLVPNVHYKLSKHRGGQFVCRDGEILGYCPTNINGEFTIMWIAHPDVDKDDIRREGERLERLRVAAYQKEKRLASGK
jgi:hypothetical protein